jgi:F0F1-type ATP synthase epsilon subunit
MRSTSERGILKEALMTKKPGIVATILAALFLFGSAIPVRALDDDRCERRIHKAEENLQKAIRKHGEHSRQAEQKRHELEEAREQCRHDHDRDHDHH